MKEFLYKQKIISLEDKINIARKNKCLIAINAEGWCSKSRSHIGQKKPPTRSKALEKALQKSLNRL